MNKQSIRKTVFGKKEETAVNKDSFKTIKFQSWSPGTVLYSMTPTLANPIGVDSLF